jgi:prepilin-type N-terminal cleavage/methylation domain-containing protein
MIIQCTRFCSIKTEKMKSEGGFTLLELMLVMVVISIIASALVMPFLSNLNEGARPDIYATATQLAMADIETQRAQAFDDTNPANVTTTINGRTYTRVVTKTYRDADFVAMPTGNAFGSSAFNEYVLVTATVTTTSPALSVTLESIITPDYQ